MAWVSVPSALWPAPYIPEVAEGSSRCRVWDRTEVC